MGDSWDPTSAVLGGGADRRGTSGTARMQRSSTGRNETRTIRDWLCNDGPVIPDATVWQVVNSLLRTDAEKNRSAANGITRNGEIGGAAGEGAR